MRNTLLLFLLSPLFLLAQPNCNYYKMTGDTAQYEACVLMEAAGKHYQFTREAFELYDAALEVCDYHAEAYYEKAVVYLKAGNFVKWSEYMERAVELNPKEFLGIRAGCDAKCWADYEGAIADIERLDSLVDYDIGPIHDGSYHLDAFKAICYKNLGKFDKAISIFEEHLATRPDQIGSYDLLHLGVCYMEVGKYDEAVARFIQQTEINEMAENQYYLALSYKTLSREKDYIAAIQKSHSLYKKDIRMIDGFQTMEDQVFLKQVEDELNRASK